MVKGDAALRFELRVDGDRPLRQLGPDGISINNPGDAGLVVVAGEHAVVGLPVGRLVRAHGGDPQAAGTQVARGRRPEHAVAHHDHVVFRIHGTAWDVRHSRPASNRLVAIVTIADLRTAPRGSTTSGPRFPGRCGGLPAVLVS